MKNTSTLIYRKINRSPKPKEKKLLVDPNDFCRKRSKITAVKNFSLQIRKKKEKGIWRYVNKNLDNRNHLLINNFRTTSLSPTIEKLRPSKHFFKNSSSFIKTKKKFTRITVQTANEGNL